MSLISLSSVIFSLEMIDGDNVSNSLISHLQLWYQLRSRSLCGTLSDIHNIQQNSNIYKWATLATATWIYIQARKELFKGFNKSIDENQGYFSVIFFSKLTVKMQVTICTVQLSSLNTKSQSALSSTHRVIEGNSQTEFVLEPHLL